MAFTEDEQRLLRAAAERSGGDLDALNAAMRQLSDRRNNTPLDDFAGLSPNEMTAFLYRPFDSPELIELPEVLSLEPAAPILDLLLPLLDELRQGPLKLTAKGNLPTKLVKELAATYRPGHAPYAKYAMEHVHNEESFQNLHVARVVAELAGLIYKRHGKLHLTNKAEGLLRKHGAPGLYPLLLITFAGKFNWAYSDGYDELPIVQQSWAFTCYLLQRFGPQERTAEFYAERFIMAFPPVVEGVAHSIYRQPEDTAKSCYQVRALERFLGFLGLADFTWQKQEQGPSLASIRPTPLLMDAVRLQVR